MKRWLYGLVCLVAGHAWQRPHEYPERGWRARRQRCGRCGRVRRVPEQGL